MNSILQKLKSWAFVFALFIALSSLQAKDSFCEGVSLDTRSRQPAQPKKIALVVGVNSYTAFTPLNYAVKDSEKMAELFRSSEEFEVILINDNTQLKPTVAEVKKKICEIIAQKPDRFLLYFSGHGLDEKGDDRNSILLKDVELIKDAPEAVKPIAGKSSTKDSQPVVKGGYISLHKLQMELEAKEINSIFLVDACRSPGVLYDKSGPNAFTFAKFTETKRVSILTSSQEGVVSQEDPNLESGIFTHYLHEALSGELQNQSLDKKVTMGKVLHFVNDKMAKFQDAKRKAEKERQKPELIGKSESIVMDGETKFLKDT